MNGSVIKVRFDQSPNVVVEWLTLMLRIRKDLGSNLGPETGDLTMGFRIFLIPSK
jgi:hypothetical protein